MAEAAARLENDCTPTPLGFDANRNNNDVADAAGSGSASASFLVDTAVERYLDENRSSTDPLSARQMRSWALQWLHEEDSLMKGPRGASNNASDDDRAAADAATAARSGCLLWKGEYVTVSLHVRCLYGKDELHFTVRVSAQPNVESNGGVQQSTTSAAEAGTKGSSRSSGKPSPAVRRKMLQRLSHDDYVAKILKDVRRQQPDRDELPILCEAHIVKAVRDTAAPPTRHSSSYEERYDTDEAIAEAVRRAVWGASSNDAMDVWEFVLQHLPLLPTTAAAETATKTNNESGAISSVTLLANRARLRLLEDAMCDACERHGDEHMVNELRLAQEEEEEDDVGVPNNNNNNNHNSRGDQHDDGIGAITRPNDDNRNVARPQQPEVNQRSSRPRQRGGGRRVKPKRPRSPR